MIRRSRYNFVQSATDEPFIHVNSGHHFQLSVVLGREQDAFPYRAKTLNDARNGVSHDMLT